MKNTFTFLNSIAFICLMFGFSANAQIVVSNSNDSGAGSFREAVEDSEAGGTITFGLLTNIATITLDSPVVIDKNLTITGNGVIIPLTTFSGNGDTRMLTINNATVVINNVSFTDGLSPDVGGAIASMDSNLTINNCTITNSEAQGALATQGGGGIYAMGGVLQINDSTISGNEATGTSGSGGGVLVGTGATLEIEGGTIANNSANRAGGGIEGNSGAGTTMTLTNVTITGNETGSNPGNGGGIHITGAGSTIITDGIVNNNEAAAEGGGLWNGTGTMTITGTTISGNTASGDGADQGGGGIYNLNGGTLNITSATITGNEADGTLGSGGGILNDVGSMLTITNTEISGNTAVRAGGGVEDNSGTSTLIFNNVELNNNTVTGPPGNGGGLHITGAGSATFTGGTVSGNTASLQGGGLWNGSGTLTLNNVEVDDNTADGDAATDGGGGIFNVSGTLVITNSSITNNLATGTSGSGGGIFSSAGTATIDNSPITGNSANRAGGGIEVIAGTYTINNADISGNDVDGGAGTPNPGNGGGVHISGGSTFTINDGIVTSNAALREGGGLWNQTGSTMTLNRIMISNNSASGDAQDDGGGGIFNNGGALVINKCTLSENIADGAAGTGGGLHVNAGEVVLRISTISGNSSASNGGGVYNNSDVEINACTITLNSAEVSGGGIYNNSAISPKVKNTIVSGNTAIVSGEDLSSDQGMITSLGYNLIGIANEDFDANNNDIMGTEANPLDAGLEPLGDNGGGTATHALDCPSPAADMGDMDDTFADQRDENVFNNRRDIGAFEAQEFCSLGTNDIVAANGKSIIYPNPSVDGKFTITFAENMAPGATVRIYEIGTGKLVKEMTAQGAGMEVEMGNFATGTYVLQVTSDRATESHKIVVGN